MNMGMHKFVNAPKPVDLNLYSRAVSKYLKGISEFDEVLAVYQIGQVKIAGISDIDLIVVLDENQICTNNYSIYSYVNKEEANLLLHDVFIMTKATFRYAHLVTNIFDIIKVYGKELGIEDYEGESRLDSLLITINDQITESLYSGFEEISKRYAIDIRFAIARLNSLKYPYYILKEIYELTGNKLTYENKYLEFVNTFSSYREQYFNMNKVESNRKLITFLIQARKEIIPQIISDYRLIFEGKYQISEGYFWDKKTRRYLPKWLLHNYACYAETNGHISDFIRSSMREEISSLNNIYGQGMRSLLSQRIAILNQLAEFRIKNNICFGEFGGCISAKKISLTLIQKLKIQIYKRIYK